MDIRNRREIHRSARHALASAPGNPRQVVLIYGGIICLLALISTSISFYLNSEIANTGGLSNMGLRSILSTIATVLPFAQAIISLGLEMGYLNSTLGIVRGRSVDPRALPGGFRWFIPMLAATIWQSLIYSGVIFVALYASSIIFSMLPSYQEFYTIMEPILTSMTVMDTTFTLDDATLFAAAEAMLPMMGIFCVLAIVAIIPVSYQYRMTAFCILDAAHPSGLAALRESRMMMRRNRFALFRLDLSFWWFYLLQGLVTTVCYGDMLLPLLGISLPWSDTVSYFLFLILYLVLQLAVYYGFMNRVNVTYATAYEAIRPKPQNKGVALGNIFDM